MHGVFCLCPYRATAEGVSGFEIIRPIEFTYHHTILFYFRNLDHSQLRGLYFWLLKFYLKGNEFCFHNVVKFISLLIYPKYLPE